MKNKLDWTQGFFGTAAVMMLVLFGPALLGKVKYPFSSVVLELLFVFVAFVITLLSKADPKGVYPVGKPGLRQIISSAGMAVGVWLISAAGNRILSTVIPNAGERDAAISDKISSLPLAAAIITTALLPAICEELFFRGFLLTSLKSFNNEKTAIIISAVAFGVMHLDLYSLYSTVLFGVLFAYLTLKTCSVIIPIALHFVNNLISVLVFRFADAEKNTPKQTQSTLDFISVSVIVTLIIIGTVLIIASYLLMNKTNTAKKSEK